MHNIHTNWPYYSHYNPYHGNSPIATVCLWLLNINNGIFTNNKMMKAFSHISNYNILDTILSVILYTLHFRKTVIKERNFKIFLTWYLKHHKRILVDQSMMNLLLLIKQVFFFQPMVPKVTNKLQTM